MLKAAEAAGFKATALKVAGAFHSPLMQPAADRMSGELDRAAIGTAGDGSVFQRDGRSRTRTWTGSSELLVEQIVSPVLVGTRRW